MEFIDRSGDLLLKQQPDDSTQATMSGRLVDRQMELIDGSVKTSKRVLDDPKIVDQHTLSNYMDKVKSLESELQGLKKEILSLNDYRGHIGRVSDIKDAIFNIKVVISRLTETKKEYKREMVKRPLISGTNLQRIEIPTFDGNIFNWRLFWEQIQAAVQDKPHLEEVDNLTYLRDALKDGPARNVVQGLTQTAESYQEAIRCLKDRYDRPRLTHREHVRTIVQAPPMRADSGRELQRLYNLWNQHIRAIKGFDAYNNNTFLTAVMELKLGETTKLEWMEHSNETKTMPPYMDQLQFMDLQA